VRLYALTETADGKHADWYDVSPRSPIGRMFHDPTIKRVVIDRTPDGAILKGAKTTIYERSAP
jgi:hypothetical protein